MKQSQLLWLRGGCPLVEVLNPRTGRSGVHNVKTIFGLRL